MKTAAEVAAEVYRDIRHLIHPNIWLIHEPQALIVIQRYADAVAADAVAAEKDAEIEKQKNLVALLENTMHEMEKKIEQLEQQLGESVEQVKIMETAGDKYKIATSSKIEQLKQQLAEALPSIPWSEYIESTPSKLGGIPLVKGTRFAVSQLLIELTDSDEINEIANNYEVDAYQLKKIMQALSVHFDKPLQQLAEATEPDPE